MSTTSTEEPTHKKANGSENATAAEIERVSRALSEHLEEHDENRATLQERFHEACEKLKKEIDDLECRINNELREKFTAEDNRLQTALSDLQTAMPLKQRTKYLLLSKKQRRNSF